MLDKISLFQWGTLVNKQKTEFGFKLLNVSETSGQIFKSLLT